MRLGLSCPPSSSASPLLPPPVELPAMIDYINGGAVARRPQDCEPPLFVNPAQATTVASTSPPTVSAESPDPGPVPSRGDASHLRNSWSTTCPFEPRATQSATRGR